MQTLGKAIFWLAATFSCIFTPAFCDRPNPQAQGDPFSTLAVARPAAMLLHLLNSCAASVPGLPGQLPRQRFDFQGLQRCGHALDEAILISARPATRITAREKLALAARANALLAAVRKNSAAFEVAPEIGSHNFPTFSALVSLENQILQLLDSILDKETWDAEMFFGLGVVGFQDKTANPLAAAKTTFSFDLGNTLEGTVSLGLASLRQEELGWFVIPPESVDAVSLNEAWMRFKRYRSLQVQVGRFPEQDNMLTAQRWPFFTMQLRLVIFDNEQYESSFRQRHDRIGTWLPEKNSSVPSLAERNLSEFSFRAKPDSNAIQLGGLLAARFHFYSDANDELRRFSYGRLTQAEDYPALAPRTYRVLETEARLEMLSDWNLRETLLAIGLRNFAARNHAEGSLLGAGVEYRSESAHTAARVYRSSLACTVAPPIQLNSGLLPGFEQTGFELGSEIPVASQLSVSLMGRYFINGRFLGGDECSKNETMLRAGLVKAMAGVGITYEFLNDEKAQPH